MHVRSDTEILEICNRMRSANVADPSDFKTILKNCDHPDSRIKQLCFTAIFTFGNMFRELRADSMNKLLNGCDDNDPEICKSIIARIHMLCKNGEYVKEIAFVEAQLLCFAQSPEVQKLASESLAKLIHLNKEETFESLVKVITNEKSLRGRLLLLHWLEDHFKKFKDVIGKNRESIMGLYYDMLGIEDITKEELMRTVLIALNSGHFHTPIEKENLIGRVELTLPIVEKNMSLEEQEELLQDVEYAVVCEEFIGQMGPRANGVIQFLFDNGTALKQLDENIRLKIFQAVADMLMKHKISKTFTVDSYRSLFDCCLLEIPVAEKIDFNSAASLENATNYNVLEALLIILHTLIPYAADKSWFTDDRDKWISKCSKFLLLIKKYSHLLKISLEQMKSEKKELECAFLTKQLIVANNIGVMLMDFQLTTPRITYSVYRSWKNKLRSPNKLGVQKSPLPVTEVSGKQPAGTETLQAKRKRARTNQQTPVNFRKRFRR